MPSVQVVEASPWASVATVEAPTVPPPDVTTNVRFTPATVEPRASSARTTRASASACPTVAVWPSPETIAISVATCSTVTVTVADRLPDVAVTVAVPFWTAVSKPVASTVATEGLSLDQMIVPLMGWPFWSRILAVSVMVAPRKDSVTELCVIVIVVARGGSGWVVPSPPPQFVSPTSNRGIAKEPTLECFTATASRTGKDPPPLRGVRRGRVGRYGHHSARR